MTNKLAFVLPTIMLLLTACGEDDGDGGGPDLFLGLSGLIIAVIVIWLILRALRSRS